MIIDNIISDKIEIFGEVQKNKIKIKEEDSSFIISLITDKLYSEPLESTLRELISNGIDAHKEINKEDIPVEVRVKKVNNKIYLEVEDFGTGLDKNKLDTFFNLGASTKRESNNYIGGFGLGRFSCLSVSNNIIIKNTCNNKVQILNLIKDENSSNISINILSEYETKDNKSNGLKYIIELKNNIHDIKFKIKNYLNKLFLNIRYYEEERLIPLYYEEHNIKDINKNYYNYYYGKISYSGIIYNIDIYNLENYMDQSLFNFINTLDLTLKFSVGELKLIPSREEIIQDEEFAKLYVSKVKKIRDEVIFDIEKNLTKINLEEIILEGSYIELFWYLVYYKKFSILQNKIFINNFLKYKKEVNISQEYKKSKLKNNFLEKKESKNFNVIKGNISFRFFSYLYILNTKSTINKKDKISIYLYKKIFKSYLNIYNNLEVIDIKLKKEEEKEERNPYCFYNEYGFIENLHEYDTDIKYLAFNFKPDESLIHYCNLIGYKAIKFKYLNKKEIRLSNFKVEFYNENEEYYKNLITKAYLENMTKIFLNILGRGDKKYNYIKNYTRNIIYFRDIPLLNIHFTEYNQIIENNSNIKDIKEKLEIMYFNIKAIYTLDSYLKIAWNKNLFRFANEIQNTIDNINLINKKIYLDVCKKMRKITKND